MSEFNLNYITVITAVVNIALGFVVLKSNKEALLNRLFFIFTIILALWSIANFLFQTLSPSLLIFQSTYSTGSLALVGALPWIIFFTKKSLRFAYVVIILTLGTLLFCLPFIDGLIIERITPAGSGYTFDSGPLFSLYGAVLLVLLAYLLLSLTLAYRKSSGVDRTQFGYTLFGISFFALVSFSFGVVLPLFGIKSVVAYDAQSSLIWVGFTAYAITQHKLFNIKVIATQAFIVLLLMLILFRAISSNSTLDVIFESVVFIFTAVVSYFLVRSVQGEVERREEVEKLAGEKTEALTELSERNKNLAALQRISDIVLNESEMKIMAQKILDEIPKQLESCAGALLSIVKDSQLMAYAVSKHQASAKILSLAGGDLEKHIHPVKKDYNLTHAVLVDKEPHDSDSLSDFISPPISKAVALTIQKLIGARHIEAFPLYAGGEPFGVMMFVFTESKDRVHEQNHSIAKAISDDMSLAIQRAQAYTKLKEANAYLADLDKLKDEFISMASHELNTPLAAIEGYLSMVLDEGLGKVDPKAKEYLNRAYDSSKRLAELILDLLNVSRIEQGRLKMKFTKTNFASLVDSVIKELQLKADTKKLYLKLETSKTELPETYCDPDRIREVFVNLIGNSIKFTDKGGITIKLSKPDDHIRAEVVDTGRGIAAEDQPKLFQKFSQVKREIDEHQGTGLGLYISKNFVELHKGRIGVTSEQGKGATFFFEIPIMKSAPKEVSGAILEKPINAAQIETGPKGVPTIVKESSRESGNSNKGW
ncbi:MAG: ATP-binding protein [Candidatus Berkelbacteria bacterium]|nr:ATP-binding protein [Candidatus Berkelbacteria bacterium]MCR4307362.1 ATP-binding protein [Candidatus Berkelbacteria bacterium]